MLAGWELAMGLAAVLLGALALGTVGFGMGLVMAPVMLLLVPPQPAVVIINFLVVVVTALTLAQTWRHLRLRAAWPFVVAGMPPVPVGVLLLDAANPTALRLVIGALILALGVMSLFRLRLPGARGRWAGPAVGFLTTLSTTTLSIGGLLAGLYAMEQDWTPAGIRATLALYFLLAGLLGCALYAGVGLAGRETLYNVGILLPALFVGAAAAGLLARRMSRRVFRYVALFIIIGGSVVVLGRELLRL